VALHILRDRSLIKRHQQALVALLSSTRLSGLDAVSREMFPVTEELRTSGSPCALKRELVTAAREACPENAVKAGVGAADIPYPPWGAARSVPELVCLRPLLFPSSCC